MTTNDTPDTDGTTIEHADPIHAAGATITVQSMHHGDTYEQHVILEPGDEPLTARQAREVAAALLEAADRLDGRSSQVLSHPTPRSGR